MGNTMDTLRVKYTRQMNEYDQLINQALRTKSTTNMPRIRALNVSIGKTLDEMIAQLAFLKRTGPNLTKERNELTDKLKRIQQEYNELAKNRDELETLRRIRQEESSEAKRELYWYLIVFFALAVILLLVAIWMSYKKEITAPTASMPPMTAALV